MMLTSSSPSLPLSPLTGAIKKAVPVAVNFKAPPDAAAGSKLSGKLTVGAPDGFTQLYYPGRVLAKAREEEENGCFGTFLSGEESYRLCFVWRVFV